MTAVQRDMLTHTYTDHIDEFTYTLAVNRDMLSHFYVYSTQKYFTYLTAIHRDM